MGNQCRRYPSGVARRSNNPTRSCEAVASCPLPGTLSTTCSKGVARSPHAGTVRRSNTRRVGPPTLCGSSLQRCGICALRGGSLGRVHRPMIVALILISSSVHCGYDDLKILRSRFASSCLVDADGEHCDGPPFAERSTGCHPWSEQTVRSRLCQLDGDAPTIPRTLT